MNLAQAINLYASEIVNKESPQRDNAALVGKPFRVVDHQGYGYGHVISEWDTEDEANRAALARPGVKVEKFTNLQQTQENRNKVFQRSQDTNPDTEMIDADSASPTGGGSQFRRTIDETPVVRDIVRRRQVQQNPDVD